MKLYTITLIAAAISFLASGCSRNPTNVPTVDNNPTDARIFPVYVDTVGDIYPKILKQELDSKESSAARFYEIHKKLPKHEALTLWNSWPGYEPKTQNALTQSEISRWAEKYEVINIFIHGINDPDSDAITSYKKLTEQVESVDSKRRNGYIYFYWDGLHSNNPPTIWGDAAWNSVFAGENGLRTVFGALPEGRVIRIITHSRGVTVALSSLQDNGRYFVSSDLRKQNWDRTLGILNFYKRERMAESLRMKTLRSTGNMTLIALAPATGIYDFIDPAKAKIDNNDLMLTPDNAHNFGKLTLVIGSNDIDTALAKNGFQLMGLNIRIPPLNLAKYEGNTAIGTSGRLAYDCIKKYLTPASGGALRGFVAQFSDKKEPTRHAFISYASSEKLKRILLWTTSPSLVDESKLFQEWKDD